MKIIDARSGQEVVIGRRIDYPDGEGITVLHVEPGILSARAEVVSTVLDLGTGRLVTSRDWVPLTVRWTHPRFFLQHVAFLNT